MKNQKIRSMKVHEQSGYNYKARIVSKDELDWNDYIKGKRKC